MSRTRLLAVLVIGLLLAGMDSDTENRGHRMSGEEALALTTAVNDFLLAMNTAPMDEETRKFASDLRNYNVTLRVNPKGHEIEFAVGTRSSAVPLGGQTEITGVAGGGGRYVVDSTRILSREFYR